jgi:hypothetical protein
MKNLTILLLLLLSFGTAYPQIRAFDNSKAILPWIYNPSANMSRDFEAYIGYDGRGNSSFTPQSIVAGFRTPLHHSRRDRNKPITMMGVQVLNTSQDVINSSTINASFSHEIAVTKEFRIAMGLGAGIFNMRYKNDDLVYFDQQDPLLNNGENLFNIHLNAGFSMTIKDMIVVNIAAPYLIKDKSANVDEVIVRVSYILPLNPDVRLITSANLDTYNHNMIFGGDLKAEWRKMVSVLAGADRYKYYGGVLLDIKPLSLGYTYGQNYGNELSHIAAHQITLFTNIPFSN